MKNTRCEFSRRSPLASAPRASSRRGARLGASDMSMTPLNKFAHALAISAMAFLTLVDLFATQAILPSLAAHYHSTPKATGFAVNATTIGMAVASLGVAIFSSRIDRRIGVIV